MFGGMGGGQSHQQQQERREYDEDELLTREFVDDLEEREPGFGLGFLA